MRCCSTKFREFLKKRQENKTARPLLEIKLLTDEMTIYEVVFLYSAGVLKDHE